MKKIILVCMLALLVFGGEDSEGEKLFKEAERAHEKSDFQKVLKISKQACKLNHGGGCVMLGWMYAFGWVVEQDFIKAVQFSQKACDLNFGAGCYSLGTMHELGNGVKKDSKKALELFKKACDLDGLMCFSWVKDTLGEMMKLNKI